MSRTVATFFGTGLLRPAPGTWGSFATLPVAWAVAQLGGPWVFALLLPLLVAVGFWATAAELEPGGDPDPSEIVIDEVAGQWLALMPVVIGAAHAGSDLLRLWPGWVAAFVLFRLFDIWKPGPIGWADRKGGATGVMLDDLIAGLFAGIGVVLLALLAHGFLM
jgi:phosphatidylglycerophosphatase A